MKLLETNTLIFPWTKPKTYLCMKYNVCTSSLPLLRIYVRSTTNSAMTPFIASSSSFFNIYHVNSTGYSHANSKMFLYPWIYITPPPLSYLLYVSPPFKENLKRNILCSSLFSIFLASVYSSASSHLYFDPIILLKQFFEKFKCNFKTKHLKIFSCFVLMNFYNSWYYLPLSLENILPFASMVLHSPGILPVFGHSISMFFKALFFSS